jgi:hypothetical protein
MVIAHLVSSEHTHRTHTNFAIFGQNDISLSRLG